MNVKLELTTQFLKDAGLPTDHETVKKYFRKIWKNPRHSTERSFRLTEFGLKFLKDKSNLKFYRVDFVKITTITNQLIIWLDEFIDCPYYFTNDHIYVSREKVAVQLILFDGNLYKFGKTKSIAKEKTLTTD